MTSSISPIEPNVILFFSVDCVGSTQLKHESGDQTKASIKNWAADIVFFYQNFRSRLEKNGFFFWKYNGDEILFFAPLKSWQAAKNYIILFQKLIQEQNNDQNRIHVKGTAWTAGFPVDNVVLITKDSDSIDFIGPDIDLGFRIATLAKKDRIAIAPDLAAEIIPLIGDSPKQWYYYGRKALKGVPELDGVPVAFLSGGTSCLLDAEDDILKHHVETKELEPFLNQYLSVTKVCVKKKIFKNIDDAKLDIDYWSRYQAIKIPLSKLHPEYVKDITQSNSSPAHENEVDNLLQEIDVAPKE